MRQAKKPIASPDQPIENNYLARIHPSLRVNFVPLPEVTNVLTDEELSEIFGGDWAALHDVVRLAYQTVLENID